MKTYKMKRIVVGILLTVLTLGFCVVGTGAAYPGQAPAAQEQGFGPGGQGGPMGQMGGTGMENGPMDGQRFDGEAPLQMPDGETPPEMPDGEMPENGGFGSDGASFPGSFGPKSGFAPDDQSDSDVQRPDGGGFGFDHQRGFGGRGGFGRDGGPKGMDSDVRQAIDALTDENTKAELETLMQNVHTAMEALMKADDDSRDAAEAAVKEARDALNAALSAAGIELSTNELPEMPEGEGDMTPPEMPEGDMRFGRSDGRRSTTAPEESEENEA